jgi:predicted aspartyl protease
MLMRCCQPFFATCLLFGAVFDQPDDSQRSAARVILPFEVIREGLIAVRGSIANLDHLRLLVDTGTYRTVIADRIARRLQLRGSADKLWVFGQSEPAERVELPHLQVGPIRRVNLSALAANLSSVAGRVGWQLDGILGLDVLGGHCLVLDYQARQLTFECQTGWSSSVPLDPHTPCRDLLVSVRIDNRDHRLVVDTGSDVIALYQRAAASHPDTYESESFSADSVAGTVGLGRFTARRLRIGTTLLHRQPVYVIPGNDPRQGHDGILGIARLAQRIQLDLKTMAISW